MSTLWQDLKFALRMLLRNRSVTGIAILALALGVGANTAIFSIVNGVLLRPLPYAQPDRLVWFWEIQPTLPTAPFSGADFIDYQSQNQTFQSVAAVRSLTSNLTGHGDPQRIQIAVVSTNLFSTLGVQPALGRDFLPAEGQPGAARVGLLSYGFWQSEFGGDRSILGKQIILNGEPVTLVGVLPASFQYLQPLQVWINPRNSVPEVFPNTTFDPRTNRGMHYLSVLGRLKPGVSFSQAQADMTRIAGRLQQQYSSNSGHTVHLIPMQERAVGQIRVTLLVLLGVVGVVLLIACANVANLLLARAASRQKEIAIRTTLGAGRLRIARQLLTESVLLALAGGALGLMIAFGCVRLLVAAAPQQLPRVQEIHVDLLVLVFTLGVSLLTGLLFGLAPALQASHLELSEVLKEGGRGNSAGPRHGRLRNLLVIAEIAMSLILLIGAGLLARSFLRLLDVQTGFRADHLVTMFMNFAGPKYSKAGASTQFEEQLIQRVEAMPAVQGVAISNDLPLQGDDTTTGVGTIEGRETLPPGHEFLVGIHIANPGFFRTMGIPLLRGREFTSSDADKSTSVLIINQKVAETFWPGQDPIGKHLQVMGPGTSEVVGVVGNVLHNGFGEPPDFETYTPYKQSPWSYMALAVRTNSDPHTISDAVKAAVASLDPDLPVHDIRTMEQVSADSLAPRRITLYLIGSFAVLALILSAVGIYGVMSYAVTQRSHEIGVRMALGAQPRDVLQMVVRHGMKLAATGVALGIAGAFLLTRYLKTLLFEINSTDPLTFAAVAFLLAAIAFLATYLPARRATRVDPMVALRYE
jgi:putative ABC transport system permease protein